MTQTERHQNHDFTNKETQAMSGYFSNVTQPVICKKHNLDPVLLVSKILLALSQISLAKWYILWKFVQTSLWPFPQRLKLSSLWSCLANLHLVHQKLHLQWPWRAMFSVWSGRSGLQGRGIHALAYSCVSVCVCWQGVSMKLGMGPPGGDQRMTAPKFLPYYFLNIFFFQIIHCLEVNNLGTD